MSQADDTSRFLFSLHPYDTFAPDALADIARRLERLELPAGAHVYGHDEPSPGLYIIRSGEILVRDGSGEELSHLRPGNSFGERGLLKGGRTVTSAEAATGSVLLRMPPDLFAELLKSHPPFARFFQRGEARATPERPSDLTTTPIAALMSRAPRMIPAATPVAEAARMMAEARISSLCIGEGDRLTGIVTIRDLSGRVLGQGRSPDTPVSEVMTKGPHTLPPTAIGSDVLHAMMELGVGHIPVVEAGKLTGIVTQTDLTRQLAISSAWLVQDIANAADATAIARATAGIPALLVQLVGSGNRHDVVTRLITDIADAATRRLLKLAEETLGPPPVPYLWLACGSQGRREQTGVSDQDNCLILDDAATEEHDPYFASLAKIVTDGLNTAGYVYCPGEMMASTPRWRQPLRQWRRYFEGWIATPNPEAQMLSSVMFDLRPIGGTTSLFEDLQSQTLELASKNSIFVAHMVANSLKHRPPLGLLRGFATIRSGEHKDTIDLKMSGVVPIIDLARLYALMARLEPVNTRARLELAGPTSAVSETGARDLLDAYDLIAETRLKHQARLVADGQKPDNFLKPAELSDFERSHLRDAFVVIRTMQSAVGQGRGTVM